jgi:hypothetical protein
VSLPLAHHAVMSSRDLSRACWRCTYWGGFVEAGMNHSSCSRMNASPLQASPATGCAFWQPGPGDSLPPGWMPVGFKPWDGPHLYGKPLEPLPKQAEGGVPGRPHLPCDQFEFDQKFDATAWRLTGELLNRARRP